MLSLSLMSQSEFDNYLKNAVPHLANEIARARGLSEEEGLKAAKNSFNGLFADGRVDSNDQYVYKLMQGGTQVGVLHFGIKRDKTEPYLYIWDIAIDSAYRRKGYGRQAMLALEKTMQILKVRTVRLNVFGHNEPA